MQGFSEGLLAMDAQHSSNIWGAPSPAQTPGALLTLWPAALIPALDPHCPCFNFQIALHDEAEKCPSPIRHLQPPFPAPRAENQTNFW